MADFGARVVQDALAEATATYWRRRADQFDDARPRVGDFYGQATPDQLRAKWHELTEVATACRNRASISLILNDDGTERPCCLATPEERADLERLTRAFQNLSAIAGEVA